RLSGFFVNALRLRLIQAAGVAVVFFALVQAGRILTGETALNQSQVPLPLQARPSSNSTNLTRVLPAESGPVPSETNSKDTENNNTYKLEEKQQAAQEESPVVTGS